MTLKSNALITVDELLNEMNTNRANNRIDYFTIYNSSADATGATVSVVGNKLYLVVTGGTSAHSTNFDLTNASYDTVDELLTAITALGKNWIVNRATGAGQKTINLYSFSAVSALLVANEQTLQGFNLDYFESLINNSSQFIENYCRRKFVSATYTEYYDGSGDTKLLLKNFPVSALASVKEWDYQSQSVLYTYTEHTEFELYSDEGIIHKSSYWTKGHKNYKIEYTAGYAFADIPSDLKTACFELCKMSFNLKDKQGYKSETIGRYSVAYANSDGTAFFGGVAVSPLILSLLAPYARFDLQEVN